MTPEDIEDFAWISLTIVTASWLSLEVFDMLIALGAFL